MWHEEALVICTVSTVKDSADNVATFVEQNLAAGADHLFVCLDDEQPEVEEVLAPCPFRHDDRRARGVLA